MLGIYLHEYFKLSGIAHVHSNSEEVRLLPEHYLMFILYMCFWHFKTSLITLKETFVSG
jgi:hypothetical protein